MVATDAAGNSSPPASTPYADTSAPVTPAAPGVTANPDGTISISGGSGAGEPGSVIVVTFPDGSSGTATVASDGSYGPVTSSTPQTTGTVSVVATDAAGNSSTSASVTYTDTTAPLAPVTPVIVVNGDETLSISGGAGAAEAGSVIHVSFPDGSTGSATVASDGSYGPVTSSTAQTSGSVSVIASDVQGNSSPSSVAPYVDIVAPTATVVISGVSADTGTDIQDFVTSDPTLSISATLSGILGMGEKVQISLNGGVSWSDAALQSGSTYVLDDTSNTLASGTYVLQARVVDSVGNAGTVSSQNLTVDTSGPSATTTITLDAISTDTGASASDFRTSDNTLIFTGTLGAALASDEQVQISLDNGSTWSTATVAGLSWSFDNSANVLADNTYQVISQVVDVAGNTGQTASRTVVVDSQGPSPTTMISIDSIASDTGVGGGVSLHDFITLDHTLLFGGSLTAPLVGDETVQISLNGGTTWLAASVSGITWSYNNTGTFLPDGTYTINVRIIDVAGNIGQSSAQALIIDSAIPSEALLIDGISQDTGVVGDYITQDNTLIFSGTLSAPLAADSFVQISLDNGSTWSLASVTGTAWSFDNTGSVMADGSYSVLARVADTAGNISPIVSKTVTVDTVGPAVTTIPSFGSISLDLGASSTDFITRDRTLLFNGNLTAPLAADETLQFSIDGGTTWTNTVVSGTNWTYDNTGLSLADNTYTAMLRVIDTAGTIGQTASQAVVIYNVAPVASVSISGITQDTGTNGSDFITSDQTLVFSLNVSGSVTANQYVQISLDNGGTWQDATFLSGTTYVFDNSGTSMAEGNYTLQARVFDVAGNSSMVVTQGLQIDASAPSTGNAVAITTYTDLVALQTGDFASGTQTNDSDPRLNGTVSGLSGGDVLQVYEGAVLLGTAIVTGATWSYQLAATADGSHTYHVVIADSAGNQGTSSSDFTLTIDTQGPSAAETISITGINSDTGTAGDYITSDSTLIFTGILGAPLQAGESVQVSVDGGSTWMTASDSGTTWTFDNSVSVLSDATYSVQARVVDAAGNIGQTASQAVVVDSSGPSASITVDLIGISLDTGASGSDFSTADNTLIFLGNVGLPLGTGQFVQISLDSGVTWRTTTNTGTTEWQYDNTSNVMADGTYNVLARVVDTAGNVGQTDSQVLTIDSTAPVGNNIEILAVSPDSGSPTDYITNTGSLTFSGIITMPLDTGGHVEISVDNGVTWGNAVVTGTTWSYDNTANTLIDGSYNLQARITDVFGNVEQTAVEVIRIDTQAPNAASTVAITAVSTDTGTVGDFTTSDNTLSFNGTLGAALQSGEGLRISLDGGTTWQDATVTGTTWSFDNTGTTLADGTYTVQAQVFDTAGNIGQSASRLLTVDSSIPVSTVSISGITTDTGTGGDYLTSDQRLVVTSTLSGSLGAGEKVQISMDGGAVWYDASLISGTTYAYDNTANTLAEGTYNFQSRVLDAAGNTSSVASQAVTIDVTGPTVGYTVTVDTYTDDVFALLGNFASGTSTNDSIPLLNGSVTGLTAGDTVRIYEGVTLLGVATVSGSTWRYQLGSTTDALHTYHAVVTDAAGNSGLSSSNFTLTVDTQAPGASKTITIGSVNTDSGVSGDFITNDNTLVFTGTLGAALAADEAVEFSLDGGITYMAATVSGLSWTFDYSATALAENTYNLKARVVDAAGNAGQTANQVLVVDTSAPSASETIGFTSITTDSGTSNSDYTTNDKTLIFNGVLGAALLSGESVQVRINSGSWVNATNSGMTWSYDNSATTLSDGAYIVDARVVDTAGNVGQTATQLVTVDSVAPTATIQIVAVTTDTGVNGDFNTKDNTLAFSGTLSAPLGAGEGVMFSLDNGSTYFSATVSGSTWTYDNTANALVDGIYNLKARVVDTAGNFVNTANQTLTVDTTAPAATITITSITTDSAVGTDYITSDTTLVFNGTLGSTLGSGERVQISLDNGSTWLAATVVGTAWSYNNTASVLANGSYSVIARVIDLADNVGQSVSQVVQIDTVAPTATAAISAITTDTGTSATDFITNDQTLIVSATLTGTLGVGEQVQISLDNGSTWNNATLVSGSTYSFDNAASALTAGSYNFRARVVDTAGNAGSVSIAQAVTIDLTPPAMTAVALTAITTDTSPGLIAGTGSNTNTALDTNLYTRDPLLTVSGTYIGTVNAGEFIQISSNAGVTWTNVTSFSNAAHTWSFTDPVAKTAATNYQLRAIDTAGNVATGTASSVVTVDTSAPSTAALMAPVVAAAYDTGVLGDNITTTATIFFASGASVTESGVQIALVNDINNNGVYEEGLDYILSAAVVSANGSWSVNTGARAVGGYHLGYMLVDQAGNRSNLTATTHLRVVGSDFGSNVVVMGSAPYETAGSLNALKLSQSGLWYSYESRPHALLLDAVLWNQASLSGFNPTVSSFFYGVMNAVTFADYSRSGYAAVVAIGGTNVKVLTTVNDVAYTSVTLSGNNRNYGGVVAYDKTGDGYLDFALGDSANTSLSFITNTAGALAWMNGTATSGSGRPSGAGPITTINNYAEISAVDLDNNGTVDIAEHTNALGRYTLTLFKNNQLSTSDFVLVSVAGVFSTPGFKVPIAMTWGDFNNDGFMDLYLNAGLNAVANNDVSSSRIYWNNHSGGFGTTAGTTGGTATYFSDTIYGSGSLAVDWNHDGKIDVIEVPEDGASGLIFWYENMGGGVFSPEASISAAATANNLLGVTAVDLNWDGAPDLLVHYAGLEEKTTYQVVNNNAVADGSSLHLQIFDKNGLNVFYANTVQLYDHLGTLVSSQIINPQMGLTSNDASALVYFYGLSATETYTAVLLNSVGGVSTDISGLTTLNGNNIEQVNATWTGLTAGLATHNYVLSAEAGANNANGNFIGTGYNDTFFATAGTDTYNGGAGWVTHYGTPAWSITGGEDIVDFTLAGNTSITVNLNSTLAQNTGFNTVTLSNIEGLVGGAGNDNFIANSTAGVNSLLDGRGGNDIYTITGGGHTLLTFTNVNNNDATGGNGSDTAIGFGLGNTTSVAAADVIDMSALLQGYTGTAYVYHDTTTNKNVLDKASEGLMNYLSVTNDGTNTQITVDRDGTGSTFAPTLVLTLNNVTTDMETLLVNHQLIV